MTSVVEFLGALLVWAAWAIIGIGVGALLLFGPAWLLGWLNGPAHPRRRR